MMMVRVLLMILLFGTSVLGFSQGFQPGYVTNEVMDDADFWKLIEKSFKNADGDYNKQKTSLTKLLKKEEIKDIVRFNNKFFSLMDIANENRLFSAVSLVHPDCGDDCFIDFRVWLIGQGKETFFKVLGNPDELSKLSLSEEAVYNGLQFCADDAFKYLIDEHVPLSLKIASEPRGTDFSKDKALQQKMFPSLWEKYSSK
jgi:Protein of unknown function (DUF4240)